MALIWKFLLCSATWNNIFQFDSYYACAEPNKELFFAKVTNNLLQLTQIDIKAIICYVYLCQIDHSLIFFWIRATFYAPKVNNVHTWKYVIKRCNCATKIKIQEVKLIQIINDEIKNSITKTNLQVVAAKLFISIILKR